MSNRSILLTEFLIKLGFYVKQNNLWYEKPKVILNDNEYSLEFIYGTKLKSASLLKYKFVDDIIIGNFIEGIPNEYIGNEKIYVNYKQTDRFYDVDKAINWGWCLLKMYGEKYE